jgi:hypothetical protein
LPEPNDLAATAPSDLPAPNDPDATAAPSDLSATAAAPSELAGIGAPTDLTAPAAPSDLTASSAAIAAAPSVIETMSQDMPTAMVSDPADNIFVAIYCCTGPVKQLIPFIPIQNKVPATVL